MTKAFIFHLKKKTECHFEETLGKYQYLLQARVYIQEAGPRMIVWYQTVLWSSLKKEKSTLINQ